MLESQNLDLKLSYRPVAVDDIGNIDLKLSQIFIFVISFCLLFSILGFFLFKSYQ